MSEFCEQDMDFLYLFPFPSVIKKKFTGGLFHCFFKELCYLQWSSIHILPPHICTNIAYYKMCCFKIVLITIRWTRLDFSFDPDIRNKCHSSTCVHLPNGPRCLYTHGHVNILERVEITVLTGCLFCIWRGKKLGKNDKPIRKARKNRLKVTDTMLYC